MKKAKVFLCILLCATLLVGLIMGYVIMPRQVCERIEAVPHTNNSSVVLGQKEVEALLSEAKAEILGKRHKDIDIGFISEELRKNPFVEKVNFIHFAGGRLVIDYTLRDVVLNVFTSGGGNYLVDAGGVVLPPTLLMTDCLMVVNGNIGDSHKIGGKAPRKVLEALAIAEKIKEDDFHRAQFRQIYINSMNEPELAGTIGGQTVLLGSADGIDEKLANLKTVYAKALSHKGYKTYTQLDARYKNRIIATKHN